MGSHVDIACGYRLMWICMWMSVYDDVDKVDMHVDRYTDVDM